MKIKKQIAALEAVTEFKTYDVLVCTNHHAIGEALFDQIGSFSLTFLQIIQKKSYMQVLHGLKDLISRRS